MKQPWNAIEVTVPEGVQPIALAGSGSMRAFLWESEEGFHFTVCRQDPETGEHSTLFRPGDIEKVAKLMAIVANTFHLIMPNGHGEDLGCLAHCLSNTLGVDIHDLPGRTEKMQ